MGPKRSSMKLLDYVKAEVTRGYQLELEEERFQARREKVYMFMTIPRELERLMGYGFFQCADAFLFLFTYLPLRVAFKISCYFASCFKSLFRRNAEGQGPSSIFRPADRCDLLKLSILLISVYVFTYLDTSVLYHVIKSQSVIKLYIFFNMLEVGDRLFASFVQDTIDALLLTATEDCPKKSKSKTMGLTRHWILTIITVLGHALVILLQGTTLSVAINANNRALLTVMMSNNFVELRGAVFRKFDKMNLFQVSCSDIRERFHLFILLLVVCLQTMREYSWEESRFWVLFPDCLMVLLAEVGVDWLKHAFITRFNEIPPEVYREYTLSLAYDLAQTKQRRAFSDHSDMVGRRLGFVPLPLAVVLARVLRPCLSHGDIGTILLTLLGFVALASFRTLNSIILLGKACDLIDQHIASSAASTAAVQSPSHTQLQPPTSLPLQPQSHVMEAIKMEPADNKTRTPSPTLQNFALQQDHLPELRKPLEKRDSKIKFARSYSASHTPRPSIGSINDLPPLPPLSSDYNDDSKLLQANSLVSILSVNFNEEMIANTEQMEAEQPVCPPKLTRKHSLGSNLVESEDVLLAQNKSENTENNTNKNIKSEPIEVDEQDVGEGSENFSFGSPGSDSVLEQTALELEKLALEEDSLNVGRGDGFSSLDSETANNGNISPEGNSNSTEVRQRVKRKSFTGWFKDLGSSSKVNENNS